MINYSICMLFSCSQKYHYFVFPAAAAATAGSNSPFFLRMSSFLCSSILGSGGETKSCHFFWKKCIKNYIYNSI